MVIAVSLQVVEEQVATMVGSSRAPGAALVAAAAPRPWQSVVFSR